MEIIKEKSITFAGDSDVSLQTTFGGRAPHPRTCDRLYLLLEREYLESGIDTFILGMDVGFDTLVAQVVIKLRVKYPKIRLIAALSYIDLKITRFTTHFEPHKALVNSADLCIAVSGYDDTLASESRLYHFLLQHSSKVIANYNGEPSDRVTINMLELAAEQGVEVVNIHGC